MTISIIICIVLFVIIVVLVGNILGMSEEIELRDIQIRQLEKRQQWRPRPCDQCGNYNHNNHECMRTFTFQTPTDFCSDFIAKG